MKTKAILTVAVPLCVALSVAEVIDEGRTGKTDAKPREQLDGIKDAVGVTGTWANYAKDSAKDGRTGESGIKPKRPASKPEDKREGPEGEREGLEGERDEKPIDKPEEERKRPGRCSSMRNAVKCALSLRNVGDRLTEKELDLTKLIAKNAFNDNFARLEGRFQISECCLLRSGFTEVVDDSGHDTKEATLEMMCKMTNEKMRFQDGQGRRHLRGGPWEDTVKKTLAGVREKAKDANMERVDQVRLHCADRGTYIAELP